MATFIVSAGSDSQRYKRLVPNLTGFLSGPIANISDDRNHPAGHIEGTNGHESPHSTAIN